MANSLRLHRKHNPFCKCTILKSNRQSITVSESCLDCRPTDDSNQNLDDEIRDSDVTPDVEAEISAVTTEEQKHFASFAARISWDPDQVLSDSEHILLVNQILMLYISELHLCTAEATYLYPEYYRSKINQSVQWVKVQSDQFSCRLYMRDQ